MSERRLYDEDELRSALTRQGLTRISEIGAGGMGAVLRAWDDAIGRWVAVKVITSFAAGDPENVRRFRGEMRLLGRIDHPAVVRIHSGHMSENLAFFLMDYVPGGNLEQLIHQHRAVMKPFTVREVAHYLAPIADALDAIHTMTPAVIHRDIKPANILIPERSPKTSVLTDFGISLVSGDTRLTSSEIVVGTEMYMAPERFEAEGGEGPAGALADNYGLALVAWEMLALRPLFVTMGRGDWWSGRRRAELPTDALAPVDSSSRGKIDAVFRTALASDPGQRFMKARDLIDQLLRATGGPEQVVPTETRRETLPMPGPVTGGASVPDLPVRQSPPPSMEERTIGAAPVPIRSSSLQNRQGSLPVAVAAPRSWHGDSTVKVGGVLATVLVVGILLAILL